MTVPINYNWIGAVCGAANPSWGTSVPGTAATGAAVPAGASTRSGVRVHLHGIKRVAVSGGVGTGIDIMRGDGSTVYFRYALADLFAGAQTDLLDIELPDGLSVIAQGTGLYLVYFKIL